MKKIIISVIMLILSLVSLIAAVYAWFTENININNIIITTGNVDVAAELYRGKDFDKDGVLDTDINGQDIIEPAVEFNLTDLCPGDIALYRLKVTNTGDYNGLLTVVFSGYEGGLQYVLVSAANQRYTAGSITAVSDIQLVKNSSADIDIILRFATLDELRQLSPSEFENTADLNAYQNKNFSMKITVKLEQR